MSEVPELVRMQLQLLRSLEEVTQRLIKIRETKITSGKKQCPCPRHLWLTIPYGYECDLCGEKWVSDGKVYQGGKTYVEVLVDVDSLSEELRKRLLNGGAQHILVWSDKDQKLTFVEQKRVSRS